MSCPRLSFCAIHRSSRCRPVCVVSKNPRGTRLFGADGRTVVTAPPMSTWPKLEELRHRAARTVRSITLGRRRGARLAISLGGTRRRRGSNRARQESAEGEGTGRVGGHLARGHSLDNSNARIKLD